MKPNILGSIILLLIVPHPHLRAADAASARLQQGLFEEEANHNLDAAITAYQSILTAHEEERKLAATALFRLGECYRKLGRTNDAAAQYQRLLRDYGEQANLTRLSEQNLFALGKAGSFGARTASSASSLRPRPTLRERSLIEEQIALTEKQLATVKTMIDKGVQAVDADLPYRQAVARLRRELAMVDEPFNGPQQRKWLEEEIGLQEKVVKRAKQLIESGLAATGSEIEPQKELLTLRRELAALESGENASASEGGASPEARPTSFPSKSDIEEKEIRRLETLIKESPDLVNAPSENPLHQAVMKGQVRVATYLLDHGAEVDLTDQNGRAPLHWATEVGDRAMIALLLDRKANINLRYNNSSPLMLAAAKGLKSVVELLISRGADVAASDSVEKTALHFAAEGNKREVAEVLLANKADLNTRSRSVGTPLDVAVASRQTSMARMLLDRGAQVDGKDPKGATPLVEAVTGNNEPMVELLLSFHADPNVRFARRLAAVPKLPGRNPDPARIVDGTELTPLTLAAHAGFTSLMRRLINAGATVNAVDGQGASALLWAARRDQPEAIDLLLEAGAEVDRRDKVGWTALADAAQEGRAKVVRSLLDHGANPNLEPVLVYPLHAALGAHQKAVVELLLERGADPNLTDGQGRTALDMGKQGNNADVIALLRKRGANEYVPRAGLITLCRISRGFSSPTFFKGTNDYNRHTMLELIALTYSQAPQGWGFGVQELAFPDLANIRISRRDPKDGKIRETKVDLHSILGSGNQAPDVPLAWGDVIEIPELDHRANDQWPGFPQTYVTRIDELLSREIEIRIKGETNRVRLYSPLPLTQPELPLSPGARAVQPAGSRANTEPAGKITSIRAGFRLKGVLYAVNVLRVSSDLSRVTVKRVDPETKQIRELVFDYGSSNWDPNSDLWLQDGDVIEVPEKP